MPIFSGHDATPTTQPSYWNYVFATLLTISIACNVGLAHQLRTLRSAGPVNPILYSAMDDLLVDDTSGRHVTLAFARKSQTTVLYIFSPSCKWCAKNLQNLQALANHMQRNDQATLIGLSTNAAGFSEYAEHHNLGFPLYDNVPSSFLAKYNLGVTPETLVLVDGKIMKDWKGVSSGDAKLEVERYFHLSLPGVAE